MTRYRCRAVAEHIFWTPKTRPPRDGYLPLASTLEVKKEGSVLNTLPLHPLKWTTVSVQPGAMPVGRPGVRSRSSACLVSGISKYRASRVDILEHGTFERCTVLITALWVSTYHVIEDWVLPLKPHSAASGCVARQWAVRRLNEAKLGEIAHARERMSGRVLLTQGQCTGLRRV